MNDERNKEQANETLNFSWATKLNDEESKKYKANAKKISLTKEQKIRVSGLLTQIPSAASSTEIYNSYLLKLPDGVTKNDLMHYKTGGVGSPYFKDNHVRGHAAFTSTELQGICFGVFSVMSMITSQYFLKEINSKLGSINEKVDGILDVLDMDRKSKLKSELDFIEDSYDKYMSELLNERQLSSILVKLQNSITVAKSTLYFYEDKLKKLVALKPPQKISKLEKLVDDAFDIKNGLDLSIWLYGMSSILEVYYSGNDNENYVKHVKELINREVENYKKQIYNGFVKIKAYVDDFILGLKLGQFKLRGKHVPLLIPHGRHVEIKTMDMSFAVDAFDDRFPYYKRERERKSKVQQEVSKVLENFKQTKLPIQKSLLDALDVATLGNNNYLVDENRDIYLIK